MGVFFDPVQEGEVIDRILVLSQRNSQVWKHMSADIAHGFRRLGLDVQFVEELHNKTPLDRFWAEIVACQVEQPPDLIFAMGHTRAAYPYGMWNGDAVFVTWVQDWMPFTLGKDPNQAFLVEKFNASKDVIFYSFPALGEAIKAQGFEVARVIFLSPGANFDRFYMEVPPDPLNYSVGFPCNVGAPMTAQDPKRLAQRLDPVKLLLDAGVKVKLWGQGWDLIDWAKPHWLGKIENGAQLRKAYNSVTNVLHSNTDTNFHQRVYETVACGRWPLIYGYKENLNHGLARFFTSKEDLAVKLPGLTNPSATYPNPESFREAHDYVARCRSILNAVR